MKLKHPFLTVEKGNGAVVTVGAMNVTVPKESKIGSNKAVATTILWFSHTF